jgi:hypothetical protein
MFIYLTRWNLFATMVSTVLGAYLVSKSDRTEISEKVLKFYWFLANNCVCFACVISLIYWTMLYRDTDVNLNNYLTHATNSLVLIVDLLIVRHPHRMSHFIYPMAFGSLYMTFTVAYPLLGGVDKTGANYVYPILDWKNKPQRSAVVGVGCVICLGIAHVIVGGIHRTRTAIYRCLCRRSGQEGEQTLPFCKQTIK